MPNVGRTAFSILLLLSLASGCAPWQSTYGQGDVTAHAFVTKVTGAFPEVNLVVRGVRPRTVVIEFGTAFPVTAEAPLSEPRRYCRFTPRETDTKRERYLYSVGSQYRKYEEWITRATLQPGKPIHRYIALGSEDYQYPCLMSYSVADESGATLVRGAILVDDHPRAINFEALDDSALERSTAVESAAFGTRLIVTHIMRNASAYKASAVVTGKRISGCTAEFDYEAPPRQGIDGSLIMLDPKSYAVVRTHVNVAGVSQLRECSLRMTFAARTKSGLQPLEPVEIQLVSDGRYQSLGVTD